LSKIPHVVILGGGFGGLSAANEIRNSLDSSKVNITIIDKKDWFMVGYAKLWIMNGSRTFENSIGSLNELPKKQINFIKDEIIEINTKNNFVKTKSENILFDFLIISMGAVLAPEKIPGLRDNGFNLYDHNQLNQINEKLNKIQSGKIAIVIMGMPYKCPPAPFEASLLVDSMLRKREIRNSVQIDFFSPAPITLPAAGPEVSKQILDLINSEKITFHNSEKIKEVKPKKLIFENNEYDFDILLAIPPHIAPSVIYNSNLASEPGFIPIDRDCKTPFENIFAIGDVTTLAVTDLISVPKAGIFAEGEGITVAKNIISEIECNDKSVLFDGKGGCFLESGRETASIIEVDMFTNQKPSTKLTESTSENLSKKINFEKERLSKWL
jgi:sulfide:quinone oxidoreductase|tara:strand:- start:1297 stop:2445 length:1149 start_codon:yes stop_codon:yes gene_type:complete